MALIDKVYISHWSPLTDRRANLEHALKGYGIEAEWVTQYDKRSLTQEIIDAHYKLDPALFAHRSSLAGRRESEKLYKLNLAEIANAITHIHFYREMVNHGYETALILEDDIILAPNFVELLKYYMRQLPDNWDMLYPGSGSGLHVPNPDPKVNVYLHPHRGSRTADSYIIRKGAAEKILSTAVPFVLPFDWELHFHQLHHDLQVYWGEPSLTAQGSETGLYQTTSPKERGV